MEKAVFPASIQELSGILAWVRGCLGRECVDLKTSERVELALEEALVNVIRHGYAGTRGKVEIELNWGAKEVQIRVRDWGPPFDPLANAPKVNPQALLGERKAGGLGIYLIGQIMDSVAYHREQDANVLTMLKRFSRTTSG